MRFVFVSTLVFARSGSSWYPCGGELIGSSTPTSSLTWISWFCSLPGHEYFCEVTEDFIEDDFNLTGLNAMVPFWREAMEMVLDVEPGTH